MSETDDKSHWLLKKEAASLLHVAEKTIERLAERGRIQRSNRKRPGSAPVPIYHPEDVESYRQEQQEKARLVAFPVPSEAMQEKDNRMDRLVAAMEQFMSVVMERQQAALPPGEPLKPGTVKLSYVELAAKEVFNLQETVQFTSTPRHIILEAIETGKLKAVQNKFGRGWRMLQSDVKEYLKTRA